MNDFSLVSQSVSQSTPRNSPSAFAPDLNHTLLRSMPTPADRTGHFAPFIWNVAVSCLQCDVPMESRIWQWDVSDRQQVENLSLFIIHFILSWRVYLAKFGINTHFLLRNIFSCLALTFSVLNILSSLSHLHTPNSLWCLTNSYWWELS